MMNAVELFCGYGGATAGMLAAGLTIEATYDLDKQAVAAHKQWHPNVPVERRDVAEVTPDELAGRFVWASPSCKPWSVANRTATRGLGHPDYYPLSKLLDQAQDARVLIIENVAGLLWSREGKGEMARFWHACADMGRPAATYLLNSNEFGVPQYRRRAFIIVGAAPIFARGERCEAEAAVVITGQGHAGEAWRGYRSTERRAELQGVPVPQGFPRGVQHRLIGNAVPPVLAEVVCRAVLEAM